jgi:hypothetical protein
VVERISLMNRWAKTTFKEKVPSWKRKRRSEWVQEIVKEMKRTQKSKSKKTSFFSFESFCYTYHFLEWRNESTFLEYSLF